MKKLGAIPTQHAHLRCDTPVEEGCLSDIRAMPHGNKTGSVSLISEDFGP